ncbi:MAG TPA: pyridoxal-phosphate dependent enzyme [Holophagaceae bacterium]|nr:pyridoxal-phosphate dependent enzyme [Holophagaceae bacterium]
MERRLILEARARLAGHLRLTPVITVELPTPAGPREVVLKLESLQITGSFKPRGAVNSLLQLAEDDVIACSGGNHGLAVAWAAARLGKRAHIYVPTTAAQSKIDAMRALGAELHLVGAVPGDAFAAAEVRRAETCWPLVHPYDQVPTVAGQGTLGLELLEQAPQVGAWLVAVGGGGFPAGVALALGDRARLIPVESEGCPGLFEAQRAGHPVPVKAEGAARTSLGAPSVGALAWSILKERAESTVLVDEGAIVEAQAWLWRQLRIGVEPGGAVTVAALMRGACSGGGPLGAVVCGGNVDALPV